MTALLSSDYPMIDLDLAGFRSRITNLHIQSIELATDLLAMLGPLPLSVAPTHAEHHVKVVDLDLYRDVDRDLDLELELVELTRTFDEKAPAAIGMGYSSAERTGLELARVG